MARLLSTSFQSNDYTAIQVTLHYIFDLNSFFYYLFLLISLLQSTKSNEIVHLFSHLRAVLSLLEKIRARVLSFFMCFAAVVYES